MAKNRFAKHAQRVQAQLEARPAAPIAEATPTKIEQVCVISMALVLRSGARVEIPVGAAATLDIAKGLAKEMNQSIVGALKNGVAQFPGGKAAPLGNVVANLLGIMAVDHSVMQTKVAQSELVVAPPPSIILAR